MLDIEKESEEEGAQLVTWPETGKDNQIWYEDDEGIIRSKLNDFALTGEGRFPVQISPLTYRTNYSDIWEQNPGPIH